MAVEKKCCDEGTMCAMCKMHSSMCAQNTCGACGGMNHYGLLRIVLSIGILAFVFWFGVNVGALTCEIGNYGGYDYSGYDAGPGYRHGGYYMMNPDMMYYDQTDTTAASAPSKAAPAPSTTKRR